jgi:hypothetical protein
LDALDHFLYRVIDNPHRAREFFAVTKPEEMVALAVGSGILIDEEDFRALLRSGSSVYWVLGGDRRRNPIAHLQQVFCV